MKHNSCNNVCSLIFILFTLFVILMCLKYYYFMKRRNEHFQSKIQINKHNTNTSEDFTKNLYNFYKSAKNYRNQEKMLKKSLNQYEENLKKFKKSQQLLYASQNNVMNYLNNI